MAGEQSLSEAEVNAQSDGHHVCIVCFSELGTNMRAKLPCGHDDMCGICHLRLRYLHDDKKCPICKQTNDTIIVDSDDNKTFESYPRWGDEIGAGFVYKSDVGMFFEEKYYNESIVPLYEYSCNKCDFKVDESIFVNQHLKKDDDDNKGGKKKKKKPRRLLVDHLRAKHRIAMCQLCIDHKRDFISQLPRFTPNQLQTHLKKGDGPGSGFNGHPICEFCRPKRFYDVNFLYQHLHKEHYKCHICEKQGNDNQWFKSYGSMARHFEKQHFLCSHVQCLEARFVVFENELDLKAHEIAVHGGTSTGSTKINLEFNIRRSNGSGGQPQHTPNESDFNYALDGQAFVPPALTNENNNNNATNNNRNTNSNTPNNETMLHPQHIQRTEELRAQAAVVRQQQAVNTQQDSFPTLQAAAAPTTSSAPLVGWSSGTALQNVNRSNKRIGQVTQEAFPTLQSNSSNKNKKKPVIKGSIGATRRQFAAMSTSADQQASWGGNNAAAAVGSIAPSSSAIGSQSQYFTSATPTRQMNRQADLGADNFPSLGGPSSSSTYASANALARQNFQRRSITTPPPSMNSASDFPSMQSSGRSTGNSSSIARTTKNTFKPPPSMSSVSDFPAPPSSRQSAKPTARQQMMGHSERKKPPENNFLPADMSSAGPSAQATLEDMKASLGQKNFKQLKKLTKTFAQDQISPEGYIDQTAELFERGYEDKDFWSYLPSLLQSCPNQGSAQHALKYMNSLKRQQVQTNNTNVAAFARPAGNPSQWSGSTAKVMRQTVPSPLPASYATPFSLTQPVAAAMRPQTIISSKKKSSWGAGGNAKIVRTKAPPGSIGVAASMQGPQGGTATKYMAKQQKKEQHAKTSNNQQNKSKKKKQKNELRDLAFGK